MVSADVIHGKPNARFTSSFGAFDFVLHGRLIFMSVSRSAFRHRAQEFMPKITRKKSGAEHVAFKLDAEHHGKIAAEAKDLGTSANLHARDILLRTMSEPAELMEALVMLNQQLFAMREELALIAEVLLSDAGKRTREEAQKWADENIKPT